MNSQSGVTTRYQARKAREVIGRHGNVGKRRTKDTLLDIQEENEYGQQYSRKSFPLPHENDRNLAETKKTSKTESFAKQKRTLSEIGENLEKVHHFHHAQQQQQPTKVQASKTRSHGSKNRSTNDGLLLVENVQLFKHSTDFNYVYPVIEPEVGSLDVSMLDMTKVEPDCVEDIDFLPDTLTTTIYSQDIIKYLMYLESRDVLEHNFLDTSPGVTSKMRGVLMNWLLQVQHHEELKDETLHLCVSLIDKFLSLENVEMLKLQLVGISCLLIASKFSERFAPEITTLCYLTDNTFVKDEVLYYEKVILQRLNFNLTRPVCVTFLDRFLQIDNHPAEIEYLARYLLDLTLTYSHLMPLLPSIKAAAALYLARQLLLDTAESWTYSLQYYTTYSQEALLEVAGELATLLVKVRNSKNQGARTKYNTERYSFISSHKSVDTDWGIQLTEREVAQ